MQPVVNDTPTPELKRKADQALSVVGAGRMDIARYLDRLETVTYSQHTTPDLDFQMQSITYGYDENSNMTSVAEVKRVGGADVYSGGDWRRIDAFAARPADLTGAGDVFAAAFLIRYADTDDPWEAARWGAAAASLVIEGPGVDAVPTLAAVEARLGAS